MSSPSSYRRWPSWSSSVLRPASTITYVIASPGGPSSWSGPGGPRPTPALGSEVGTGWSERVSWRPPRAVWRSIPSGETACTSLKRPPRGPKDTLLGGDRWSRFWHLFTSRGSDGHRPAEDGLVFRRDRFRADLRGDRFAAHHERLKANRSRGDSAGAVRNGSAPRAGGVRCGRCGKRRDVRYKRSGRPSYGGTPLPSDYGLPAGPSASAAEIEGGAEQVVAALPPAAREARWRAAEAVEEHRRRSIRPWQQRIERAKYEAQRAARQEHAGEPENRPVARTRERRRDELPREAASPAAEFDRFPRVPPRPLGDADRPRVRPLAEPVPTLGHAATTTPAARRRIARRRIARVVVTVAPVGEHVVVRIDRGRFAARWGRTVGRRIGPACRRNGPPSTGGRGRRTRSPRRSTEPASGRRTGRSSSAAGWDVGYSTNGGCGPADPAARASAGGTRTRGGCTRWPRNGGSRRTRCTAGGRRAGCTPGNGAAEAARGRCGPAKRNGPGCGS
jgi:hypothetical protein